MLIPLMCGQPLCLDHKPPFEVKKGLPFCSKYQTFGCCTQDQVLEIKKKYDQIEQTLNDRNLYHCKGYLKEILCSQCSPYSAHMFDSFNGKERKAIPGLCDKYCDGFYRICSGILRDLSTDEVLLQSISEQTFCSNYSDISNETFCFSDLENNLLLNMEISTIKTTSVGCMCVEEFADNLRNPLLLLSPPDTTGRIFIGEQRGVVYIYDKNGSFINQFMNLSNKVKLGHGSDELGFLGMVFDPGFASNSRFYVYYTVLIEVWLFTRISEFKVSRLDPNTADTESERILLQIKQPTAYHNGGMVRKTSFKYFNLEKKIFKPVLVIYLGMIFLYIVVVIWH